MPRTYVDNAMNRSLGRVGMPHGSMVVSRSGGGSSYTGSSYGGGGSFSSSSSSKTYVDNSYNRRLGRVGMEHGTAVVSKSDTASNRSLGSAGGTKTYVDNSYNRRLGRVGMEHGTAVVSKTSDGPSSRSSYSPVGTGTPERKVYKDNPMNRRLNRVGLPHGTAVHSKSPIRKTYVDNAYNRSVGRAGKPLGSMPISRRSKITSVASDMYRKLRQNPEMEPDFSMMDIDEDQQYEACDIAASLLNRIEEVLKWKEETQTTKEPHTSDRVLKNYRGTKIDFKDIEMKQKIGSGGFGDVHFAKWNGTVVAVKKLRVQRVSKRRLKDFTDEIFVLCELDHPNIVKFIGASIVTPNLCIVMEYMQMSLFDALHIKEDVEFSEDEKLIIIRQTAEGMRYLHECNIAHCDMKSQNILLDFQEKEMLIAKITDFGLSMMKNETETSTSTSGEYVRNIGTPRYSSPENLRGELLNVRSMMMSDMYSYSLVVYEIVCEEEPFYKLNYEQLKSQVGNLHLTPDIPTDISLNPSVFRLLNKCWDRKPKNRPTARMFSDEVMQLEELYQLD